MTWGTRCGEGIGAAENRSSLCAKRLHRNLKNVQDGLRLPQEGGLVRIAKERIGTRKTSMDMPVL